jgi:hypothetical protein
MRITADRAKWDTQVIGWAIRQYLTVRLVDGRGAHGDRPDTAHLVRVSA